MDAAAMKQTTTLGAPAWAKLSSQLVRRLPVAKYRVMNWLCKQSSPAFIESIPGSDGLLFECDLRNGLAREVYFTGRYEPLETELLGHVLKGGDVFVDVGAHWGYFSLLAAKMVGAKGRVVAIEADPRIHRTLARNRALNGLDQLQVVHVAAAAEAGTLTLAGFSEAEDNWGISRLVAKGSSEGTFRVPAKPLDGILDELGLDHVDLVKMDIEGAESLALEGMREGLAAGRYRRLMIELHPAQLREQGLKTSDVIALLQNANYRGWSVNHTPKMSRRAAYGHRLTMSDILKPLEPDLEGEAWPHVVFVAPGVSPPQGV